MTSLMDLGGNGDTDYVFEEDEDTENNTGPMGENDSQAEGEVEGEVVDNGSGVGALPGPPAFLGPMSLEAMDTDEVRHRELTGEEQSFADRAFLIEQTVRSSMYELTSGSAREVVRRLLLRQHHVAEIQFWLSRALQQALRCCPGVDDGVDWDSARQREEGIWGRILGMEADDPILQRLRQVTRLRLERREQQLREVERRLGQAAGVPSHPYNRAMGRFPSTTAGARDGLSVGRRDTSHATPTVATSTAASSSDVVARPRPSCAPHLLPRATPDDAPGDPAALHGPGRVPPAAVPPLPDGARVGPELSSTGPTGVVADGEMSTVAAIPHGGPPDAPPAVPAVPVLPDGENEGRVAPDAVVGENVESEEEGGGADGQ